MRPRQRCSSRCPGEPHRASAASTCASVSLRRRPAENKGIAEPDHEEAHKARGGDVGKEVPAERHPQHGGHHPEHGRRHVGQRPPRRRRQRGRRIGPERGGAFAGEERAVTPALPARVPPRHELPRAVELRHHHRPRPPPVALEGEIGQHDGGKQDGDQQKHRRTSRNQHRPVRPHQLSHDGNQRRQRQRPGNPHRSIAREDGKPVLLQRKRCARGIVE